MSRTFNLKTKVLLSVVGLGLAVATISSWGNYKTTQKFSKATSSTFNKNLGQKALSLRVWGALFGLLARGATGIAARTAAKAAMKTALKEGAKAIGKVGPAAAAGYGFEWGRGRYRSS